MAGWKKVKEEHEVQSVQYYLANANKENNKVSKTDLTVAIASVGLIALQQLFAKKIGADMAVILNRAGAALGVTSLVSLFAKNPSAAKLQKVLDECAKINGTHIITSSALWEYTGHSGNNTTWEIRTDYQYH